MLSMFKVMLGDAVLVIRRKLFWLPVGAIGFVIGLEVARRLVHGSEITSLLTGLVIGVIFAVLAIFVESVAIGLVGFPGGGHALLSLGAVLGSIALSHPWSQSWCAASSA